MDGHPDQRCDLRFRERAPGELQAAVRAHPLPGFVRFRVRGAEGQERDVYVDAFHADDYARLLRGERSNLYIFRGVVAEPGWLRLQNGYAAADEPEVAAQTELLRVLLDDPRLTLERWSVVGSYGEKTYAHGTGAAELRAYLSSA